MPLFGICGAILTFGSLFGPGQYAVHWPLCAYAVVGRSASFMLLFGILGDIMTVRSLLGHGQQAAVLHACHLCRCLAFVAL